MWILENRAWPQSPGYVSHGVPGPPASFGSPDNCLHLENIKWPHPLCGSIMFYPIHYQLSTDGEECLKSK